MSIFSKDRIVTDFMNLHVEGNLTQFEQSVIDYDLKSLRERVNKLQHELSKISSAPNNARWHIASLKRLGYDVGHLRSTVCSREDEIRVELKRLALVLKVMKGKRAEITRRTSKQHEARENIAALMNESQLIEAINMVQLVRTHESSYTLFTREEHDVYEVRRKEVE